ncbi:MAG: hypothetical protein ACUVRA_00435 [Candidatus Bathyarchaeaceae archaeon]
MLLKLKRVPKGLVSQLQIGKARIPRILLGTSPFVGAGQFGSRAHFYYEHFYKKPKNIVKIVLKAVDLGVTGVQTLPFRPVFRALKAVERELKERLTIVGTIGPDDPLSNIRDFQAFNTAAMLLHGEITDRRNSREISELLNKVHSAGCLVGLVTHEPLFTLNWLPKTSLDVDLLMVPFNKLGMFMDADPAKVAEAIKRLGKPVIGKKVLAAGYIPPKDALNYVAQSRCIDMVALGVASEQEAQETFTVAAEAFSGVTKT